MQRVLNRLLAPAFQPILLLGAFTVLARTLLVEEEEEDGDYAEGESKPVPRGLRAHEKEFLQDIEDRSRRYNGLARFRLRTAQILSGVSLASTAAVPVVIAASLPNWAAAVLAAVAGVSQGVQQIRQDNRLGLENHLMAVDLSRASRKYRLAVARFPVSERTSKFDDFVREVEELQASSRSRFLEIVAPRSSGESASSIEPPSQLPQ